jgi:dihydrofolate synthase/folylpolyglutamate synthase
MKIPHWPIYTGPNKDYFNTVNRVKCVLSKINNPHLHLKNIIHITGTKGKGSTALFISNILRSSGYKVNTYISPHIYECNERILLDGVKVKDEELYEATELVRLTCEKNNMFVDEISMFEALTCSAFSIMSKHEADFNVIEVGMGGKYDATNVFDDNPPIACVFTPIHLDHTKFLGTTVKDIAIQKSYLIKKNASNVILSSQSIEAKTVLKNVAKNHGILNIFCYGEDYEAFYNDNGVPVYESKCFNSCFSFQKPNMPGDYQLINASCAISTCIACLKNINIKTLTPETINIGIKNTFNIVRMQKIENGALFSKLPQGSIFYIDGAHNQLAAHALASWIKSFKQKNKDKYTIFLAVARTKGVDNKAFLKEFLDKNNKPIIDVLIATRANLESIPEPPEIIAKIGKNFGFYCKIAHDITKVIDCISNNGKQSLLICTGSLYIARDIMTKN